MRQTRNKIPILFEIFLGVFIVTLFFSDYLGGRYFLYKNYISANFLNSYRYVYEIVIGQVGWYIFLDMRVLDQRKNMILKAITIIVGTNFITAMTFINFMDPNIQNNSIGLLFLLNRNVTPGIQTFIFFTKIYGLGGLIVFIIDICILIYRSKIYSKISSWIFIIGYLSLLDIQITIPTIDMVFNLNFTFILLLWILGFVFVIAARINKINFKTVFNIHELVISNKVGITLYAVSDQKIDPNLVSMAISGVNTIMGEISGSSKPIKAIDQGDKQILFESGKHITALLLVDEYSIIVSKMLKRLVSEFETNYGSALENWNGNIDIFEPSKKIIDGIFTGMNWKKKEME